MKVILGTKQYMTQIFDDKGVVHAVTAVQAGPVVVTQVRSKDMDGYSAVQVGFGAKKAQRATKAQTGHIKKAKEKVTDLAVPQVFREFDLSPKETGSFNVGDKFTVGVFAEGDTVRVIGTSKSKGFAGVVKRHNFKGQPRSHGQKHSEHAPGSLGMAGVQRVFKNKRMAGRTGGERVGVKNLKVVKIDVEKNLMYVSGAVPGRKGTLLMIDAK